ncbi:hypothetical protein HanRHA438_Chr16g0746381 [Helianthus annuus]|nr:hypothetical protein HanRHA438_Chr16g0746381 [Helianthus annuus]
MESDSRCIIHNLHYFKIQISIQSYNPVNKVICGGNELCLRLRTIKAITTAIANDDDSTPSCRPMDTASATTVEE